MNESLTIRKQKANNNNPNNNNNNGRNNRNHNAITKGRIRRIHISDLRNSSDQNLTAWMMMAATTMASSTPRAYPAKAPRPTPPSVAAANNDKPLTAPPFVETELAEIC